MEGRGPRRGQTPVALTPEQRNRYQRHLLLPEVGVDGQAKLLDAKVLLLGAGGLGSPAALYLAAAGVGTIGIVDMDVVDESNLQRQILHNLDRIGDRKVDSAKKTLDAAQPRRRTSSPTTSASAPTTSSTSSTGYDVIVDGADNFPTRYLLNDASREARHPRRARLDLPLRGHGHRVRPERRARPTATWCPSRRRPSWPRRCAEAGVLGVLPGIIGSIQALETIKLLLGLGDPLIGRLLAYDALEQSFRTFKVRRDPSCPACSIDPADIVIAEYDELCMPHRAH